MRKRIDQARADKLGTTEAAARRGRMAFYNASESGDSRRLSEAYPQGCSLTEAIVFFDKLETVQKEPITGEEIKTLISHRELTLTKVIDVVCELNGFVGVGYLTFGDQIAEYIKSKASKGLSTEAWLNN